MSLSKVSPSVSVLLLCYFSRDPVLFNLSTKEEEFPCISPKASRKAEKKEEEKPRKRMVVEVDEKHAMMLELGCGKERYIIQSLYNSHYNYHVYFSLKSKEAMVMSEKSSNMKKCIFKRRGGWKHPVGFLRGGGPPKLPEHTRAAQLLRKSQETKAEQELPKNPQQS